jgi:hypothetical protein
MLLSVSRLHIEHGYPDPLLGCLRLQRVVKGIKRCKGGSQDKRLPITPDILSEIYRCLDFAVYDDVLFWAACCLVYFGFLRSSEFTVPHGTSYSPSLHLSHQDVAFDRRVDSSCLQVFIKVSKTDPFSAREHSGSGSFSLVSGRIATRLLGDKGSCRRPSVRPFQWRPPDTYSFYRASAPTAEPDWYNWSFWKS